MTATKIDALSPASTLTGTEVVPVSQSGVTKGATVAQFVARVLSALGSIATQAANAVTITGGTINGTAIGGTTRAAGAFSLVDCLALRYETYYVELASGGTYNADGTKTIYLVSSYGGLTNFVLPAPADHNGKLAFVKKVDTSSNAVKVMVASSGFIDDTQSLNLASGQFLWLCSNGSKWHIVGRYGI